VTWIFEYFNHQQQHRALDQTYVFGLVAVLSAFSIFVIFVFHKRDRDDDDDDYDYEDVKKQTLVTFKA
jgi:hypothetical protein